jgi:tRNA G18 (ribose-2'-O)-methylase SpoU
MVSQAAERTSNQISHLVDRHRASRSQVLRNSDAPSSASNITKNPLVVVLVDVRSSSNVGQILRTADAVAAEKIVCVGITPTPDGLGGNKVRKVSLGSEVSNTWGWGTWRPSTCTF